MWSSWHGLWRHILFGTNLSSLLFILCNVKNIYGMFLLFFKLELKIRKSWIHTKVSSLNLILSVSLHYHSNTAFSSTTRASFQLMVFSGFYSGRPGLCQIVLHIPSCFIMWAAYRLCVKFCCRLDMQSCPI